MLGKIRNDCGYECGNGSFRKPVDHMWKDGGLPGAGLVIQSFSETLVLFLFSDKSLGNS